MFNDSGSACSSKEKLQLGRGFFQIFSGDLISRTYYYCKVFIYSQGAVILNVAFSGKGKKFRWP
jgi:hypothetical protein